MLSIPLSTVGWIILKAREVDAKDAGGADPGDEEDNPDAVLLETSDDPSVAELTSWIGDLTETQQAELVALFWLGRDDGAAEEFAGLVDEARGQQGARTATYLLGSPMLADHLEAGLETLGISVSDLESNLG
ncbi:MAG: DUF3775 domain-containing protein [Paracoccaceae bacterium]